MAKAVQTMIVTEFDKKKRVKMFAHLIDIGIVLSSLPSPLFFYLIYFHSFFPFLPSEIAGTWRLPRFLCCFHWVKPFFLLETNQYRRCRFFLILLPFAQFPTLFFCRKLEKRDEMNWRKWGSVAWTAVICI